MLTAILLTIAAVEPYMNPNNPNAPSYVRAEDAALQTTFAVEKFPKSLAAGRWADQGIAATDKCYIPAGITVMIDTTDAVCESVRVDGTLKFARDKDTKLFVTTLVGPLCSSTLDMGTPADPITAKCEVVFRAKAVDINDDPREFGTGYVGHRTLIWGIEKQSQADFQTANAGATSVTFSAPPRNWAVGDVIVLAGPQGFEQDEKRTITAINGATVSFAEPLQFNHAMPDPKVGLPFAINLTRNVVFRSENEGYGNTPYARFSNLDTTKPIDPVPDPIVKQRGHFMVMGCGVGNSAIGYASFNDLGRTDKRCHLDAVKFKDGKRLLELGGKPSGDNQVGRYALHFHHGGRQGTPAIVKGCAVNGSPGWGFTNHSSNVHFSDCVSYDCIGANFSCEIGNEVGLMETCAAIRNAGGFADKDGTVNNPDFDREQGMTGGFWFQGSRVRGRNLKAANCNSGLVFWAPPGTQVYSNNPNRNADNIMGSIDPADVDPNGPDAYLLDFLDAATGTIDTSHVSADIDGLLIIAPGVNSLVVGPNPAGPKQPGTWKRVSCGGVQSNYSTNQRFIDCYFSTGPKAQPPYIWAFRANGGDSHSFEFTRCTINNFGQWTGGVSMGVNVFKDSTSNQGGLNIGGNYWANISSIPLRPREVWIDNTVTPLFWEGEAGLIPNRVVVDGKQLYGPKSEPDFVPYPTVDETYTPPYYKGKTNAQLLAEFGVAVCGDVTPADAVFDAKLGHKVGPVSKRVAVVCRNSYQDLRFVRPSGTVAKVPIEVYPLKQHTPTMVHIDHPVKPGWQPVFFDFEGQRYSVNVFGTGSTPPPEPPVPPPLVVTTVEVTPANLTLEVGKTAQLTAVVKDQFGAVMPGKGVTWKSSNPALLAVSASGVVTALSAGSTTVTSDCEGKQGAANLTVTSPPPPAKTITRVTIEYTDGTSETKP